MAAASSLYAAGPSFVLMPFNATGDAAVSSLSSVAHRWHMPADTNSNAGLGGGLAWVLEPDFCERIISRFPEESVAGGLNLFQFVTCTEVAEAIARGFATWEKNHKHITFRNLDAAQRRGVLRGA